MDDWRSALVRTLVTGAAGDVGSGGVDGDADGGVADVSSARRGASAAGGLVRAGVSASSLEEGEQLPFEQPFRDPNMKAPYLKLRRMMFPLHRDADFGAWSFFDYGDLEFFWLFLLCELRRLGRSV